MKGRFFWAACVALSLTTLAFAVQNEGSGEKKSIKEVMKAAMGKQGILEKLKSGEASTEEKTELLNLFIDLYESEPPKGEIESWHELAGKSLLVAAKAAAGREVTADEVMQGCNCMECHKAHQKKGRR